MQFKSGKGWYLLIISGISYNGNIDNNNENLKILKIPGLNDFILGT